MENNSIVTTLKKGDKYIYPTTYYNQIIMPNGSRWNGTASGEPGPQGPTGVGISKIEQTVTSNAAGGENIWTITLTDGTVSNFIVKNGTQGPQGIQGPTGSVSGGDYVPLAGGTMTGKLQVNNLIFGNNYSTNGNNVASFVWDKPGSNYTGMGAYNGESDTIYFGACDTSGAWVSSYRQKWKFNGSLIVGGGDDACNIVPWTNNYSTIGTESLKWHKIYSTYIYGDTVYGAVWNDYAEYREVNTAEPGRVVYEVGDDTLALTFKRMMPACSIISDTYGFAIGETEKCKTPLAQAGRVLAYPLEDRCGYNPGDAVCSGPNGTISKMTQEEKVNYPECIIGYVSCVPDYEVWGKHDTKVNGRIWIKVV